MIIGGRSQLMISSQLRYCRAELFLCGTDMVLEEVENNEVRGERNERAKTHITISLASRECS